METRNVIKRYNPNSVSIISNSFYSIVKHG